MKRRNSFYGFLKIVVKKVLHLYYRKFEVHGFEQIPDNVPLIFTPNHQGTFMDAILTICGTNLHIASLSRADIFKNPLAKKLLNAFMMIPIYRPRDKVDIQKKNEQVFNACSAFLQKKGAFIIFPEGNNGLEWHLRTLKKGCARLAFGAEVNNQFNLNLHIIPVGIQYSKHSGFRSNILVSYAKPIRVADYETVYKHNTAKGINQLMKAIRSGIQENILHFPSIENYDAQVMALRILQNDAAKKKQHKKISQLQVLETDQNYVSKLTSLKQNNLPAYETLIKQLNTYINLLKQHNLKDKTLSQNKSIGILFVQFLGLFFLCLVWLWAVFNCGLAYVVNWFLMFKMGLSIFFTGAIKFTLGLFVSSFLFLIQAIVVAFLFKSIFIGFLYFVSLPFLGIFWYHYNVAVIKFSSYIRKNRLFKRGALNEAADLRQTILQTIHL